MSMRFCAAVLTLLLSLAGMARAQSNMGGGSSPGSPGTVGGGAAPNSTISLSPNCPASATGTPPCLPVSLGNFYTDFVTTTSSPNVSSATATFTSADVGKTIYISATCFSGQAYPNLVRLTETTILSVTDAHDIVANANATNGGSNGCGVYGPIQDTQLSALDTAVQAAAVCPSIAFPTGIILTEATHFTTQPPACTNSFALRAWTEAGGVHFKGTGQFSSILALTPNFATSGCPANGCFGFIQGSDWEDMSFFGDNFSEVGGASAKTMFGMAGYMRVRRVGFLQYAGHNAAITGMATNSTGLPVVFENSQLDGFGSLCLNNQTTFQSIGNSTIEDCGGQNDASVTIQDVWNHGANGLFNSIGTGFGSYIGVPSNQILFYNQAQYASTNDDCFANGATNPGVCIENFTGGTINFNSPQLSQFATNGQVYNHGGTIYAANTSFVASGNSGGFAQDNSGVFIDGCNNTLGTQNAETRTGSFYGSCSITGTTQVSGNFAIAPASSATFSAVTGSSLNGQFTATWAGTPSTTETVTMTFPVPFITAPRCTVVDVGGNNPFPTAIDTTNTATTTATLTIKETFAVAPTVGNTDIFVWNCSN